MGHPMLLKTANLDAVPEDRPGTEAPPAPTFATIAFSTLYTECYDDRFFVEANGEKINVYTKGTFDDVPLIFFVHGAGFSGLSFGPLVKRVHTEGFCAALDLRGHGLTINDDGTTAPGDSMTIENFVLDCKAVLDHLFTHVYKPANGDVQKKSILLCGHSLGGSIVARLAAELQEPYDVQLCCLIDINETVAIGAIPNMMSVLRKKPLVFSSEEALVNWLLSSHTLSSRSSALFQAPGLIHGSQHPSPGRIIADLINSNDNWRDWFVGLNDNFLSKYPGYKLLFIGGMEKLDKETEIAHMQGKLSIEVVPNSGHNLHEDNPNTVAFYFIKYLRRMHLSKKLIHKPFDFKKKDPDEDPVPLEEIKRLYGGGQ
ncbi:Protein phosphatase methylesterase-1 [Giardia lamblia P15]|uniref:Protein phosphatase methylesterase 1 n=1 Tax=Giardia intestinalis (strain P15) TaxID=658858 RepID=E1F1C8_GIAIA|nr:Protein phosphatase methylesterase-1 [Giardia lamblia P15]